jgi:hypothetical protein
VDDGDSGFIEKDFEADVGDPDGESDKGDVADFKGESPGWGALGAYEASNGDGQGGFVGEVP